MNTPFGKIITAVGLATVAFLGTTFWMGTKIESWYRHNIQYGNPYPNVELTITEYQRGFFQSRAMIRVQFTNTQGIPDVENPSFQMVHEIFHGPFPWIAQHSQGIPLQWGIGAVRIQLDTDSSAWTRALAKVYGEQAPLTWVNHVSFAGHTTADFIMPPLHTQNVGDIKRFDFSGLEGHLEIATGGSAMNGRIHVGDLAFSSQTEQLHANTIQLIFQQKKAATGLMLGDSTFDMGVLKVQVGDHAPVDMRNLHTAASLKPEDAESLVSEMIIRANAWKIGEREGHGNMTVSLHHLDSTAVGQLQALQERLIKSPEDGQIIEDLLTQLKILLAGKPEMQLQTDGQWDGGDWKLEAVLQFQDQEWNQLAQSSLGALSFLEKGNGTLSIAQGLLDTEISGATQGQGNVFLQGLLAQGFVRLEGDHYVTAARFEDEQLFINDKEIPFGSGNTGAAENSGAEIEVPLESDEAGTSAAQ